VQQIDLLVLEPLIEALNNAGMFGKFPNCQ
jgi:hypothetical protein